MSMDGITAGLLLQAASNGNSQEDVYKLYKDLQGDKDAPTPEVIELVTSWIGSKCKILHTSHIGVVVRANTSETGLYAGGRYPAYVKITESGMERAVGCTFEYGLDQIELLPEE
ncbi:MAG: hypothetical protein HGA25_03190 [Clostridiales bacterium]|nr:hypothetical protein [Clostridiales bacterium]